VTTAKALDAVLDCATWEPANGLVAFGEHVDLNIHMVGYGNPQTEAARDTASLTMNSGCGVARGQPTQKRVDCDGHGLDTGGERWKIVGDKRGLAKENGEQATAGSCLVSLNNTSTSRSQG